MDKCREEQLCLNGDCILAIYSCGDIDGCEAVEYGWIEDYIDCHLTSVTEGLIKLIIKHGISDEDTESVEKAIAGKGPLWCLPPDIEEVLDVTYGDIGATQYFFRQDQGGGEDGRN